MKIVAGLIFAIVLILVCSVIISPTLHFVGGAGKIKGYQYPVTKVELEKAIQAVLKNGTNVHRDTNLYFYSSYDSINKVTTESSDSTKGSVRVTQYYNDGVNYLTVYISANGFRYEYILGYYGDSTYWKESQNSEIAIIYAYDEKNNGGSEGGEFKLNRGLETKLTSLFESEFIDKVDKQLMTVHVNTHN